MVGLILHTEFPQTYPLSSSMQVIPNHSGLGAARDSEWPLVLQYGFLLVIWTSIFFTLMIWVLLCNKAAYDYFYLGFDL